MLRLSECINEGFFGDGYEKYKRKVLDALSSIGIVIDSSKMGRAEKWIRDYYTDKMSAYQCASAVRDAINKRDEEQLKEAFEKFAVDVIDSAPVLQKKRAAERIKTMTREQKDDFDEILLRISEEKGRPAKELASDIGYEIVRLIQDGMLTKEEIIERLSRGILKSGKMNIEEAIEIIKEAGRRIDKTTVTCSDWMDMVKEELIKLGYGPVTANSYVTDEWRADIIQNFKDGYTPKESAESLNRFLEEQERDETY